MKRYFVSSLLLPVVLMAVLAFVAFVPAASASTSTMTISQFVEMLISVGAIPADRIVAARAMAVTLSVTPPTTKIATSTTYIQVFTPNGGEGWEIDLDLPYSITWGSSGLTFANVALVSSNSKTPLCNLSLTPVSSKDGNHEFKTLLKTAKCYNLTTGTSTPLDDGTYKARIYYTDAFGTTVKDESNATFRVVPKPIPSMKVSYPNGEEQLVRHDEYAIRYTLTNVDEAEDDLIYYYLLDNLGNIVDNGHKLITSAHTFDYEIPSNLSAGAYKMKLKLTTDEHVLLEDTSDNFFWVSTGL
jgi:hypothetical protein